MVVLNITLFLFQTYLMAHYRRKMINFDLTYNIVTPNEIFFLRENGFSSEMKAIEKDIIRTIDGKYPSGFFFGVLDL
jgi:hypothetical protein